ncbi:MAG TPA: hypothetical protein VFA70_01290, partial [Dehalococcoidia bacterium]|nr:hypothetical protein [Dehalococcoidia bacterium]
MLARAEAERDVPAAWGQTDVAGSGEVDSAGGAGDLRQRQSLAGPELPHHKLRLQAHERTSVVERRRLQ